MNNVQFDEGPTFGNQSRRNQHDDASVLQRLTMKLPGVNTPEEAQRAMVIIAIVAFALSAFLLFS